MLRTLSRALRSGLLLALCAPRTREATRRRRTSRGSARRSGPRSRPRLPLARTSTLGRHDAKKLTFRSPWPLRTRPSRSVSAVNRPAPLFTEVRGREILRSSALRSTEKFATRSQRPSYGKDSYFRGYAGHTRESMLPSLRGQRGLREGDQT